jgi:hypothetical protein
MAIGLLEHTHFCNTLIKFRQGLSKQKILKISQVKRLIIEQVVISQGYLAEIWQKELELS